MPASDGGAAAAGASNCNQAPTADEQADEQEPLLEQRYGTTGFAHASPFAKTTYTFVSPLLALGARNQVRPLPLLLVAASTAPACSAVAGAAAAIMYDRLKCCSCPAMPFVRRPAPRPLLSRISRPPHPTLLNNTKRMQPHFQSASLSST